jgi:hypothetical protein
MKYLITDVVVADNPQLNVTKAYLSRSLASLEFDDSFERRIPAAMGSVSSQEPYAKAELVLNLKDGPLSREWSARILHDSIIGSVSAYDVNGARKFNLSACAIRHVEPDHDGETATRIIIGGSITKEDGIRRMNV